MPTNAAPPIAGYPTAHAAASRHAETTAGQTSGRVLTFVTDGCGHANSLAMIARGR